VVPERRPGRSQGCAPGARADAAAGCGAVGTLVARTGPQTRPGTPVGAKLL